MPSSSRPSPAARSWLARHRIALAIVAAVLLALVLATWRLPGEMLRAPLEQRLAEAVGAPVTIGALEAGLASGRTVRVRDLRVADPHDPGKANVIAGEVEMRFAVLPLARGDVVLKRLTLRDAEVDLQRDADGRWNLVGERETPAETKREAALPFTIEELVVERVRMRVRDAVRKLDMRVDVAARGGEGADQRLPTRISFAGRLAGEKLVGDLRAGDVLSLQGEQPMPVLLEVQAGRTEVGMEGEIANALGDPTIDARVRIAGPSLADLYPTLPVALPATAAYRLTGHLQAQGKRYRLAQIDGRVGRSDLGGEASFDAGAQPQRLEAKLASKRLALTDLGVLIGVDEKPGKRVLPDARFDVARLRALDAQVSYRAAAMQVPPALALEDFAADVRVAGGVLYAEPFRFGFSGGDIVARLTLDARPTPLAAELAVDFRNIDFSQLFPTLDTERLSAGKLGAQLRLAGRGRSVAELLASADGTLGAAMAGGRISHTVLAAASLDGGRLIPLLLKGDEPIGVRCAVVAMSVAKGIARAQLLTLDTETTRVDGDSAVDLVNERFALELRAKPKRPSLLSLRGPVFVEGTFRDADIAVSTSTLLRGGAALALTIVNPLAALLPLIETGGGEDSDCKAALAPVSGALDQAQEPAKQPPAPTKRANTLKK